MESSIFNIVQSDEQIILKCGRRKYATISQNKNPEYNWCLWINSICLSGYNTPEEALKRAEKMKTEWEEVKAQINNQ